MKNTTVMGVSLGIALSLIACDEASGAADAGARVDAVVSLDGGSSVDAGSDAGGSSDAGTDAATLPTPTAEERAACAHLMTLEAGCLPGGTETACAAALAGLRRDHGEPDCLAEYGAYVACLTAVDSCDTGGAGVLCPTEYSALGMCSQ